MPHIWCATLLCMFFSELQNKEKKRKEIYIDEDEDKGKKIA